MQQEQITPKRLNLVPVSEIPLSKYRSPVTMCPHMANLDEYLKQSGLLINRTEMHISCRKCKVIYEGPVYPYNW